MTIKVCEVGPRDGLQNFPVVVPVHTRAELIRRLAEVGCTSIEAVSFVHPKRVPQMAGAEDVISAAGSTNGVSISGLVLNEKGYDRLVETGLVEAHFAFGVTESFNLENQNANVASSVELAGRLAARAAQSDVRLSVTLTVAFGCPFEGTVDEAEVLSLAEQIVSFGVDEIYFADTIGVAVPGQITRMLSGAADLGIPLGIHLHNTRNTGIANAYAALSAGVSSLDAAVGGLGGCPFAPGASGNVATEDLVYLLEGEGVTTGIDLDGLIHVAAWLSAELQSPLPGALQKAGNWPGGR